MKKLTQEMITAIEAGGRVVLCTVLASSGSSPRGAGARMAVFSDGTVRGTVGGGQVEFLAQREAAEILKSGKTVLRSFNLAPEQINSIGMICGGSVTIYYQLLTAEALPTLRQMLDALCADENSWLYLRVSEGVVTEFRVVSEAEAAQQPALYASHAVLQKGEPLTYTEPLVRAGRVYLFGGGHVGQALIPVLAGVDFRVTLFDNRPELAKVENFPAAEEVILGDYENIFDKISFRESDYAVIMTPGHQSDFALLSQVLRHKLRYVGCIGSKHKIVRTQQLLREAGIDEERIQSVHSPIGLPILAETPAEIAVSIAAEMIECRAKTR